MLVLSRHRDESIIIITTSDGDIKITVVDIRGDKVRLGIAAPMSVPVHREEVHKAILREQEQMKKIGATAPNVPPKKDKGA